MEKVEVYPMGNILENLFCSKANILCYSLVLANLDPSIRHIGIGVDHLLEHALDHVVDGDPGLYHLAAVSMFDVLEQVGDKMPELLNDKMPA